MWIALTILFALLSLVLYLANRELSQELKLKDMIIDKIRLIMMDKKKYYLDSMKRIEDDIKYLYKDIEDSKNTIKRNQDYIDTAEAKISRLKSIKDNMASKLM